MGKYFANRVVLIHVNLVSLSFLKKIFFQKKKVITFRIVLADKRRIKSKSKTTTIYLSKKNE